MAVIKPFKGVLYNKEKVGNLDAVVTPPYDVISQEDQQWYYDRHPNNVVRLILPKESGNKYVNSASCLGDWLGAGILAQDSESCIYAYEQEYEIGGQRKRRLGFTCLIQLESFERRTVLPHENILAKPLEDRLNMIRATHANFDSVFGLYANNRVEPILRPFMAGKPDLSAVDKDGVRSDLWRVSDPEAIEAVCKILADESVVIADGHHRYSAALAYRDEMQSKIGTANPDAPYNFVMMTLVSLEDKGLVVLPTHRVVYNLRNFNAASFCSRLAEYFELIETPSGMLVESMSAAKHVFGLYLGGGKSYIIKLKPTVQPERVIETPGSDALKRLDVSVLHSLILEKLLGIGVQQLSAQSNLSYTRDPLGAMKAIDKGEKQALFVMNPTRVDEVKAVASTGERMPQKSTFFYPKLLTGIVMRVMPRLDASR